LGFEREPARHGLMKERPRSPNESIINKSLLWKISIQGIGITMLSFIFYYFYAILSNNPDLGRTTAFISLVISQILLLLLTRERAQVINNKVILLVSTLTIMFITAVVFVPFLRALFHFSKISIAFYAFIFLVSILSMSLVSVIISKLKRAT